MQPTVPTGLQEPAGSATMRFYQTAEAQDGRGSFRRAAQDRWNLGAINRAAIIAGDGGRGRGHATRR